MEKYQIELFSQLLHFSSQRDRRNLNYLQYVLHNILKRRYKDITEAKHWHWQLTSGEWVASRACESYKQDDRQRDSRGGPREFPSKYSPGRPEFSLGLCPYMGTADGERLVSLMGLSFIAFSIQLPRCINRQQTTTLSSNSRQSFLEMSFSWNPRKWIVYFYREAWVWIIRIKILARSARSRRSTVVSGYFSLIENGVAGLYVWV